MDRRATLATMLGLGNENSQATSQLAKASATVTTVNTGLEPFAGEWTFEQAAHLLRRATFGPTIEQIKEAAANGLDATVEQLFADIDLPAPPINYDEERDPYVPIGQTWINSPYNNEKNVKPSRWRSLRGWIMMNIMDEGISIREKLTLFWHNHFAVNNVNDPRYI